MTIIKECTLQNECIDIDDKMFIDCNLVDCFLKYSGGEVTFERTRITGCSYLFKGAANSTLRVLDLLGANPKQVVLWQDPAVTH